MSRLCSDIRDRAVASAKSWRHDEVDGRHVLLAIGTELEIDGLPLPEAVLAPRGDAIGAPQVGIEVDKLIERCTTPDNARDVLAELSRSIDLGAVTPGHDVGGGATERQLAQESAEIKPGTPLASTRSVDEILADLDGLVGLESVKQSVARLVHLHTLNLERERRGLPTMPAGLNLVFTGSPGTGKTTVARLVAELYRSLNLLPRGQLIETHRAELVAGYVGQTAIQVGKVVQKALGGVLFIDEAYALASESQQDYGSEAVATLVKMMEDNRPNLAVIVAGYTAPMSVFIRSNAGLRSRFQQFIEFPDYEPRELLEIFLRLARSYQIDVSPEAQLRVESAIASAPDNVRSGNARFIRNLLEQSYSLMAARANADGVIEEDEIHTLRGEDVPVVPKNETATFGQYL